MADERWQIFSPLPARAMADEALAALDIRVLAALAAHDRFGANGIGCYASHPRLASLVKCHLKSLSRSLRMLAEHGYIEASLHPLNRRLRVYRVVYLPADKEMMKGSIGNDTVTDTDSVEDPIGNQTVPEDGSIGNQHFQELEQYQSDAGLNIFSEAVRYPAEAVKDNSPEGAPPYGAEELLGNKEPEPDRHSSDGQYLGKVQTWLNQHSPRVFTEPELADITKARDACLKIEDEQSANSQGGIGGWAQRLVTELDTVIENGAPF